MAKQVSLRKGTTAQNDAFTGAIGELTADTEAKKLRLHDGETAGGWEVGPEPVHMEGYLRAASSVAEGINAAALAADSKGLPLQWPNRDLIVTEMIGGGAALSRVHWLTTGHKITLNTATHQQAVLFYTLAAGADHRIEGPGLIADCALVANIGIYLRQTANSRTATLYAEGLEGRRARRNTSFIGCHGVYVRGGFKKGHLVAPKASDIALPAGTGSPGVVGAVGVGVERGAIGAGESFPEQVVIERPDVDGVYSLDAAYVKDMDGIKVFCDEDTATRQFSKVEINSPKFRNCWGRDIKIQASTGVVRNPESIVEEGPTGGIVNPAIDFQNGPGRVEGGSWLMDGVSRTSIVSNSSSLHLAQLLTQPVWDGGEVILKNGATLTQAPFTNFPRTSTYGIMRARNVTISGGSVPQFANVLTPDNKTVCVLENIQGAFSAGLARVIASGGASPYRATVRAISCVNTGSQVPVVLSRISGVLASAITFDDGCVGFGPSNSRYATTDSDFAGIRPFDGLYPANVADKELGASGVLRGYAVALADGAEHEFPAHGYFSKIFMAMVSVANNRNSQAIISCDGGGLAGLGVGSSFTLGTTADPGSGLFRLWSGPTGLVIKNASGSARVVSVLFWG